MAKTNFQTIDEYHIAFAGDILMRMQTIRNIIHKVAPDATETISYQIPKFKLGKFFLVYYSGYTNHISISSPWSEAFLLHFEHELKGMKVTRAAIQLPLNKPLPEALIEQIIQFRMKEIT